MNALEIVSPNARGELQRTDTPEALVMGLETVVRTGITRLYDDVAWVYYHGPGEELAVRTDPFFQRLLRALDERDIKPDNPPLSPDVNVLPKPNDLVRTMAAKRGANSNGTTGGGFWRIEDMEQRRYIAVPAHHVSDDLGQDRVELDIDLGHGICFDGDSLVVAMYREGFEVETIRNREGHPKVYREKQIGEFFVSHTFA